MAFVHLHVHSEYSLLDAMCRVRELVDQAAWFGLPALALTDHGVVSGAIKFYQACHAAGLRPILGCELYVATGKRSSRQPQKKESEPQYHHLVVLAQNRKGWENLVALVNRSHTEGFYYKPRVDLDLLSQFSEGLIALSGCESGEVQRLILQGRKEEATAAAGRLAEIFSGRFYIELQHHGLDRTEMLIQGQLAIARRLKLPYVASADVHYIHPDDHDAHRVLINIQGGKRLSDPDSRTFEGDGYHFLTEEELRARFREVPEAVDRTLEVAERCELELPFGQRLLPRFPVPEGTPKEYLERLAWDGARERYGDPLPAQVKERLAYELSVIERMDLSPYFLIVADFVSYAKREGIPVGPGRGSAAGSLVAYCLGITQVDPLKYGLLFERFLNPDRVSLPDIDIDFCIRGRDRVIRYAAERYGQDHLAQIGTFDRMASRSVVRDVARVLGLPYAKADRIAKLIPAGCPLREAAAQVPELQALFEEDEEVQNLFAIAFKLEGLLRNASTHAAGVVIAPEPLERYVPLLRLPDAQLVTQFDMHDLEALGLLKMDFLGLRNLTLLSDVAKLVEKRLGIKVQLEAIPLDDEATFELIRAGGTTGVFQFEGAGMRALIRRLSPTEFRDLIAILALYRPGPLEAGLTEEYIERKHGRSPITYPHPAAQEILSETYGLPIYQDQVMLIAQKLAGFSLSEADLLRKAIGKKKPGVMAEMEARFVQGCVQNGIPEDEAKTIFADIEKFARYGFAKAHACAYAFITYWTAYFKAHYPTDFMAALLSSVQGDIDKVAAYIGECREMGIEVLPPDINESDVDFTPVGEGKIRFGLGAIKHVGRTAVEAILGVRDKGFHSFFDFCRRIDPERVNREAIEALIKAGAMDGFGPSRRALLSLVDEGLRLAKTSSRERLTGQRSFFDVEELVPKLAVTEEEFKPFELLKFEKELLGLYLSGHPLDEYAEQLRALGVVPLAEAQSQKRTFRVAGRVKKEKVMGNGRMAFITLEDKTGEQEIAIGGRLYWQSPGWFAEDSLLILRVKWTEWNGIPRLSAEEAEPLERDAELRRRSVSSASSPNLARCLIELPAELVDEEKALWLSQVLAEHPGPVPTLIRVWDGKRAVTILAGPRFAVQPSFELVQKLERLAPGIRVEWQ